MENSTSDQPELDILAEADRIIEDRKVSNILQRRGCCRLFLGKTFSC